MVMKFSEVLNPISLTSKNSPKGRTTFSLFPYCQSTNDSLLTEKDQSRERVNKKRYCSERIEKIVKEESSQCKNSKRRK